MTRIAYLPLASLILAGCGRGPIDPSLAVFISPDTQALVGVRMDQLRATPAWRKLAASNLLPRLDPVRLEDIREILLAGDGKQMLAIATGAFETKPAGLDSTPYRGHALFATSGDTVIAFLDRRTALAGGASAVRVAIDQYESGERRAPPALMARAQSVPGNVQIWAVVAGWQGLAPDRLREMGNAGNVDRVLRSVSGAYLTIDLRAGLHATAIGDCRNEADAKTLSGELSGLAGLARLAIPRNRPDLQRAYDGIRVTQDGRTIRLTVDLTEDQVDGLLDAIR